MIKTLGKHLTIDMYGCTFETLNNLEFIKSSMFSALQEANMILLDSVSHKIESQGLTVMAILADSHMSIHTYPELGYAAIDVFSTGDLRRPDKAITALKRLLKPEKTKTTTIKRGDFGSERDMKPKVKLNITPMRRVRDTGAKMLHFLKRPR